MMSSPHSLAHSRAQEDIAISAKISVLALFVYDYILNFSDEVELIWRMPFHFATVLYFCTRYLPFVGLVFEIATVNTSMDFRSFPATHTCKVVLHFIDALNILARGGVTVVFVAQAYAIYNQNTTILLVLGSLGIVTIILDGMEAAVDTCSINPPNTRTQLTTVNVISLALFSTTTMATTLYRVLRLDRRKKGFSKIVRQSNLTGVILFETFCMSGVCVLRLFNVVLFVCAPTSFNLGAVPFLLPVAAIFVSHFLLSLRSMNQDISTDRTATTALAFTTFPLEDRSHFTNFEFAEESVMERAEPRSESSSSSDWDSGSSADWDADSSADWDADSSADWDVGSSADSGSISGSERREHGEYWTQVV